MGSFLYVQINIVNIIVLTIMMLRVHRARLDQVTSRRCFQNSILFSMLMNLFDAFWTLGLHGQLAIPQELLKCINAGYFLSFAISSYFWLFFTEATYGRNSNKLRKWWSVATFPIGVLFVLLVISNFNGCMFYFDANGVYQRGPLFYLQHILPYCYVLVASIRYMELALKQSYRGMRGKFLTYMSFSIPAIVCAVIQVFLQQFPILSTSPVLSFLIVYTEIIQGESVIDPLTGIHNRKHLKEELDGRIRHLPKDRDLYFLFMDVDGFKLFNDRFGHLEGDRVLQTVAKVLSEFSKNSRNLCLRYGGDEFAMIVELPKGKSIESVATKLQNLVQQYSEKEKLPMMITLSIGATAYQRDVDTPETLVARADTEMYKKKKTNTTASEADIDPLTGILDSTGFHKKVKKWLLEHPGQKYRVCRYNIDHFKDINGMYGYDGGDVLLRDISSYMHSFDTEDYFCGHLSADHFVRFSGENTTTPEECHARFVERFRDYGLAIPISIHIGVYDLCEEGEDSFKMSYKALLALQTIKYDMNRFVAYYEKGTVEKEQKKLEILKRVDPALENQEFEIYFQPQVDYAKKEIFCAEALVRWRTPSHGLLSPGSFIPLLEKSNYIEKLDRYVIEHTCRYLRDWMDRLNNKNLTVSVNLSRRDVVNPTFLPFLVDLFEQYQLPHGSVHLEITESAYMEDPDVIISSVRALQENGFVVEIDDFGSGYSSLNILKDLSVDCLKLDMKFLSGESSKRKQVIIGYVIQMAHALNLSVIAEGVETEFQADVLLALGCTRMQGYYFSKPIPANEYEKLLFGENCLTIRGGNLNLHLETEKFSDQ